MQKRTLKILVSILVVAAGAGAVALTATLEDVILLAQSDLSDDTIVAFLEARELELELGAEEIARLRDGGVSEAIIRYLLERTEPGIYETEVTDDFDPYPVKYRYPPRYYATYYGAGAGYYYGAGILPYWGFDFHYLNHHSLGHHDILHPFHGLHSSGGHSSIGGHGLLSGGHGGAVLGLGHLTAGGHIGVSSVGHVGRSIGGGHSRARHVGSGRHSSARHFGRSHGGRSHSARGHGGSHSARGHGGGHSGGHGGSGHSGH